MNRWMTFQVGLLSLSVIGGSLIAARLVAPTAALAQATTVTGSATDPMTRITAKMERRLARNGALTIETTEKDVDRAYVGAMSAITPAIIALCRQEIASGKDASIKAAASKILSVGQEQERSIAEYEQRFHIDHSN